MMDFPDEHKQFQCLLFATASQTQRLCDSFSRVQISGTIYRCSKNYSVLAKWFNGECRPGRVCRFLSYDVVVKQGRNKRKKLTFVLAEVNWFKAYPERNWFQTLLKYGVLILKAILKCLSFQLKEFTVNV